MNKIKFSTISTLAIIFTSLFLSACGKSKKIDVDHKMWREDLVNCGNYRKSTYKRIIKNSNEYIGILEEDITNQLGSPDKEALEKRMKKSIRYQVTGYDCNSSSSVKKFLVFELETLRRVRSIYVTVDN